MGTIMRVRATSTGYTGGPGVSTFHFGVAVGDPNDAAAVLACQRVIDAFTAGAGLFPGGWSVSVSAQVDTIDEATGALVGTLNGTSGGTAGNGSDSTVGPSPVGLEAVWLTAGVAGTHRVKGRTYLVPVNGGANGGDGTPSALAISRAMSFADAMNSPGANDCVFGVYSRPFAGKTGIPARPGSFHGCTGHTVPDKFVVLRSRRD